MPGCVGLPSSPQVIVPIASFMVSLRASGTRYSRPPRAASESPAHASSHHAKIVQRPSSQLRPVSAHPRITDPLLSKPRELIIHHRNEEPRITCNPSGMGRLRPRTTVCCRPLLGNGTPQQTAPVSRVRQRRNIWTGKGHRKSVGNGSDETRRERASCTSPSNTALRGEHL